MVPESFHLVSVNFGRKTLGNDWTANSPELLRKVTLTRRPTQIKLGDYLVYYTSDQQRLIAIVRSSMKGADVLGERAETRSGETFTLRVTPKHVIESLEIAPGYEVLGRTPEQMMGLSTQILSDEEARLAWDAFTTEPFPEN
jgi:hypothetical protein